MNVKPSSTSEQHGGATELHSGYGCHICSEKWKRLLKSKQPNTGKITALDINFHPTSIFTLSPEEINRKIQDKIYTKQA
jgi:hypothetical protein